MTEFPKPLTAGEAVQQLLFRVNWVYVDVFGWCPPLKNRFWKRALGAHAAAIEARSWAVGYGQATLDYYGRADR